MPSASEAFTPVSELTIDPSSPPRVNRQADEHYRELSATVARFSLWLFDRSEDLQSLFQQPKLLDLVVEVRALRSHSSSQPSHHAVGADHLCTPQPASAAVHSSHGFC